MGQVVQVITTTGSGTYTVPAGVSSLDLVECWGAGGGVYDSLQPGSQTQYDYFGGDGGCYSSVSNLAVTPGASINYSVGSAGGFNAVGGSSWFSSTSIVLAPGGGITSQGKSSPDTQVGSVKFTGGLGSGAVNGGSAYGGGGSASKNGNGGNASGSTGGSSPGAGAAGVSNVEGGGGGSGSVTGAGAPGGGSTFAGGGRGQLRITYTYTTPPSNTAAPVVSQSTNTMSSTTGTWSNNATSYSYQWFRGSSAISGATASTYTLQAADAGQSLTCQVKATNDIGTSTSAAMSNAVTPAVPNATAAPAITGVARKGSTLSCSVGTWANNSTGYTYQWYNSSGAISGATASTYTPVAADVGSTLYCYVQTANNVGTGSAKSNTTTAVMQVVFLTGLGASASYTLPSDWNPSNNLVETIGAGGNGATGTAAGAYSGGTGGAYAAITNYNAGAGSAINVQVGAVGSAIDSWVGSTTTVLAKAGVTPANNTTTAVSSAAASASVGTTKFAGGKGGAQKSTTISGGGGGAAGPNGVGGAASTSAGAGADNGLGGGVSPQGAASANSGTEFDSSHGSGGGAAGRSTAGAGVAGGNYGGGGGGAQGANTGGQGAPGLIVLSYVPATATNPPSNTAAPTISGTTTCGQTLSVSNGSWSNAPTSFAYQWYTQAGAAISGATAQTYVLTASNVGGKVYAKVTATNSAGSATQPTVLTSTIAPSVTASQTTLSGAAQVGQTLTATANYVGATAYQFEFICQNPNDSGDTFDMVPVITQASNVATATIPSNAKGYNVLCSVYGWDDSQGYSDGAFAPNPQTVGPVTNAPAQASVTIAAQSAVQATARTVKLGAAPLAGLSAVQAAGAKTTRSSAAIAGLSVVSARGYLVNKDGAGIAGQASVQATGYVTRRGGAVIAGASTTAASAKRTTYGAAASRGQSAVTTAGRLVANARAQITPASSVSDSGRQTRYGAVPITAQSTLTAYGRRVQLGSVAMASRSSAGGTAMGVPKPGSAAIVAQSSASFTGRLVAKPHAPLQTTSVLTATGSRLQPALTTSPAQSSVAAAGVRIQRGSVAIGAQSSLQAKGGAIVRGSSSIAPTTIVVDNGVIPPATRQGQAQLTPGATLAATGRRVQRGSAAIQAQTTQAARGGLIATGSASMSCKLTGRPGSGGPRVAYGSRVSIAPQASVVARPIATYRMRAQLTPHALLNAYLVSGNPPRRVNARAGLTAPVGADRALASFVQQVNTYLQSFYATDPPSPPKAYTVNRPADLPAAADYPYGEAFVISISRKVISDGTHWLRQDTYAVVA